MINKRLLCFKLILVICSIGCLRSEKYKPQTDSTAVKELGSKVVIATRNAPTCYYYNKEGDLEGFEYELASAFVKSTGRKPEFKLYDTVEDIILALENNEVHFAAAGLMKTDVRKQRFQFSPDYQMVAQLAVCHESVYAKEVSDLIGKSVVVTAKSSYDEIFERLKNDYTALEWESMPSLSSEQLLEAVNNRDYDCVAVDETIYEMNRHVYRNLDAKFVLDRGPYGWLFSSKASSLVQEVEAWFDRPYQKELIRNLNEKYYGSIGKHDVYDLYVFRQRIETLLPQYQDLILTAAEEYDLDPHLLAAVAYQESHWNPRSKSPTGVRGFMMLTLNTAKALGVKNRLDPKESIFGGARYLRKMINKFPAFIAPEDRKWFGLASYNVGYGHLQDARRLAIDLKKNPNEWLDVKTVLPLLSNRKYYKRTRYGYARGQEPVNYVNNIRNYEQILVRNGVLELASESH